MAFGLEVFNVALPGREDFVMALASRPLRMEMYHRALEALTYFDVDRSGLPRGFGG